MVTRKPLPDKAAVDPVVNTQFRMQDVRQELWSATESESSAENAWAANTHPGPQASSALAHEHSPRSLAAHDVPDALRPGAGRPNSALSSHTPSPTPSPAPALSAHHTGFDRSDQNVWREETAAKVLLPDDAGHGRRPSGGAGATDPLAGLNQVPDALRPGSAAVRPETNPFKRKPTSGTSHEALDTPPMPLQAPPPPPIDVFSQLSVAGEPSNNPWQPALDERRQPSSARSSPVPTNVDDRVPSREGQAWASKEPSRRPSPNNLAGSPSLMSFPSEEDAEGSSAAWDEIATPKTPSPPKQPAPLGATDDAVFEDRHAWDDVGGQDKGKAPALVQGPQLIPELDFRAGGDGRSEWNLMDNDPQPGQLSRQSTWENFEDAAETPAPGQASSSSKSHPGQVPKPTTSVSADVPPEEKPPALPPRSSTDAPPKPPRPSEAKAETYQIKNVNWHDAGASKNPRTSPILVQIANGPCPLVALVNALTLTTPADTETALVESLRSREQISLSFLLDAVFDELMSPRRLEDDASLPDVSELYEFLKSLHTGMNVNPRFVPTPAVLTAFKRTSLTHIHPSQRSDGMIPGTFEDTREMQLYATFSIPLIHGWIPATEDPAYEAFRRHAESYEDAQNLLFREEELEAKLTGSGLTAAEQHMYQDILTVKSFLSISATQLTPHGLDVITGAMKPGSVAILFRNDHFSTLYRHPQTLELLTLVTDAGYAGHAEVVWESLVDVNGERAEFFSGDFRLVGGAIHDGGHQRGSSLPGGFGSGSQAEGGAGGTGGADPADGWTTVQGRRQHNQHSQAAGSDADHHTPLSPSSELEDRDLALAMQLQEEEDERHREEQARRHRESLLSERYIEQQTRRQDGSAAGSRTGRRSSSVNGGHGGSSSNAAGARVQVVRPLVPPPASSNPAPAVRRPADDGSDDAPPSYEQASKQTAYVPPAGHPSHPSSSPRPRGANSRGSMSGGGPSASPLGRRVSSFTDPVSGTSPRTSARPFRQGVPPVNGGVGGKDRDCVVM